MIESLLGSLLGLVSRSVPEVLKWIDRKQERAHELAMNDRALEFEKLRGVQKMQEIGASADAAYATNALETLRSAITSQGAKSGIRWADALSTSVRPVITYAFFGVYAATKVAAVYSAVIIGASWQDAIQWAWSPADMALFSGILNFWFMSRVFDKMNVGK